MLDVESRATRSPSERRTRVAVTEVTRCHEDRASNVIPGRMPGITNKCSQADRPISTGELNTLLYLHFQPINLVFYQEPDGETSS